MKNLLSKIMEKKTIVIIVLSIALLIVSYIAFKPNQIDNADKFIQSRVDSLNNENVRLQSDITAERVKSSQFQKENDSLQSLKPKIKIVYYEKSKKVDSSFSSVIVDDFKSVFADRSEIN